MIDTSRFKLYREKANLSKKYVAKKLKVKINVISDWENANSLPDDKQIIILAKLYNISYKDFYVKRDYNYIYIIVFIVVGLLFGLFVSFRRNIGLGVISFYAFSALLVLIKYVYREIKYENNMVYDKYIPRSFFGLVLDINNKKKRIKFYMIEALEIASVLVCFNVICELLNFDLFLIRNEFFSNDSVNSFIIYFLSYLLVLGLSFIIELVFGEYMVNKYKRDEKHE